VKYFELAQNWVRQLVCELSNTIPDFLKTDFFILWPLVWETAHFCKCLPKCYDAFSYSPYNDARRSGKFKSSMQACLPGPGSLSYLWQSVHH